MTNCAHGRVSNNDLWNKLERGFHRPNNLPRDFLLLVRASLGQSENVVHRETPLFSEGSGPDPPKLSHVRSNLQHLSHIVDQLSNVSTSLTAHSEQNLSTANLHICYGVDPSFPYLSFDSRSNRRLLVDFAYKLFKGGAEKILVDVPVESHHADVFFPKIGRAH